MAITASQKKQLEAAGYTVKGDTVLTKSGGSVGGYNKNGQLWSGSTKVRDILKTPDAAMKAPSTGTTKPTTNPKKTFKQPERPVSRTPKAAGKKAPLGTQPGAPTQTMLNSSKADYKLRKAQDNYMKASNVAEGTSNKPFVGTTPTAAELAKMSTLQKLRWGVLFSKGNDKEKPANSGRIGRGAGMAKGGMVKKGKKC